jgi:hypothetical protein
LIVFEFKERNSIYNFSKKSFLYIQKARLKKIGDEKMSNRKFYGSWKVLIVLIGISVAGLFMMTTGQGDPAMFLISSLIWAGFAYLYWRKKSK